MLLKGLTRDDIRMYYGECYYRVGDKVMCVNDVSGEEGNWKLHGHEIISGNEMIEKAEDVDFSFPKLGYMPHESYGAVFMSRAQGRNYKKGYRPREAMQSYALDGVGNGARNARQDKKEIHELMFPTYVPIGKARARVSKKFKDCGECAYAAAALSQNFCVVRDGEKKGTFHLLYRRQIVGTVAAGSGDVDLLPHCRFIKNRLIKEVDNVKVI